MHIILYHVNFYMYGVRPEHRYIVQLTETTEAKDINMTTSDYIQIVDLRIQNNGSLSYQTSI